MVALKTFGMDAGQAHLAPHVLIIHRTTIYIIVVVVYHTTHMSHSPRLLAFLPPRHFLRRVSVPPCSGGGTLGPMPRGKAPPPGEGRLSGPATWSQSPSAPFALPHVLTRYAYCAQTTGFPLAFGPGEGERKTDRASRVPARSLPQA
ncbi:hypothetical protein Naga_101777g1 [Nannochloropsis gaditana]|uniref:Uncharacterized protein n=1 Tax=Nannochloropsis gaditana TaxID=72520 RepID=W7T2W0_9STRA|nr:hypothetical protein Naga_101777g1 [Nannochloropsis gaditana]